MSTHWGGTHPMPARYLGGLLAPRAGGLAPPLAWRPSRRGRHARLAVSIVLTVILAGVVGWFIDTRLTQVMLAELVARAADQVELGVVPRVSLADFEPPHTPAKLDAMNTQL